jgi:hypothetical protein
MKRKAKSVPRKTDLQKLLRSHKHVLRALKHQTEEIGHLRRMLLEIRNEVMTLDPGWAPPPDYDQYRKYRDQVIGNWRRNYSPTDSCDSPGAPLV